MFIKAHHNHYIVFILCEVDDVGKARKHNHSIMMSMHTKYTYFDLEMLMVYLDASDMEILNQNFEESGYVSSKSGTTKTNAIKLSLIFQNLDRYALLNV